MISFARLVFCSGVLAATSRAEVTFSSGPAQVALIELYTSEGCSSCPPAEKWLGELRQSGRLWQDFVPVALHVNYWDHLGWRDILASKAFTDREYAYAAAWGSSSVYTPCFVRNGLEWHPGDITSTHASNDVGNLTVTWRADTRMCRIDFTPATTRSSTSAPAFDAQIALLGGGIVNQVRKGENAGRELSHEFVALRLETASLKRGANGSWTATVSLPPRTEITSRRSALAAWVVKHGDPTPVQSAGGWIDSIEPAKGGP